MRSLKSMLLSEAGGFFKNVGGNIVHPETKEELINEIKIRLDQGQYNLNDIDTSKITDMSFLFSGFDNYDLSKFSVHTNSDSNKRTVKAINKIITAARNSKETKTVATLDIKPDSSIWEVDPIDSNYISKTYSINAPTVTKNYKISFNFSTNTSISSSVPIVILR